MHKNNAGITLRRLRSLTLLLVMAALAACSDSSDRKKDDSDVALGEFVLSILSSPADQVSGGAARVSVGLPQGLDAAEVEITLDGTDVSADFSLSEDATELQGVVSGLTEGDNQLTVNSASGQAPQAELVLTNHPATGPIFSGPQQQPFLCATDDHRASLELGPVMDDSCSVETVVSYKYRTTAGAWADYSPGQERPMDIAETTTITGETVDFIVRWERGTINRFLYSIAILAPDDDGEGAPELANWNRRLIYYFQGGVAIGHYQGSPSQSRALYADGLAAGYAVAYSTGTKTGTHYNLQLGGETAIMVKDRFVTAYAAPDYTVGVGGSGGGIQQYVYAQNHPGLIDAGVPQYSYPDMITQTIHIGDCELIERWIDLQLREDPQSKWADWNNRTWLIGLNANNDVPNDVVNFGLTPWVPPGSSECTASWRGLSPLALNHNFGDAPGITPKSRPKWNGPTMPTSSISMVAPRTASPAAPGITLVCSMACRLCAMAISLPRNF